jgi:uncharacterized membrane protein YGL010W
MQRVQELFADYSEHHRTPGNKWCHRIGIPAIMLSLLGMLARVTLWPGDPLRIDAAMVLIALTAVFYLRLDPILGSVMVLVSIAFYFAGAWLPMSINIALFVGGWILQFIGHSAFEKRQPAFLRNLVHLLVGPLWLLNSLVAPLRGKTASAST